MKSSTFHTNTFKMRTKKLGRSEFGDVKLVQDLLHHAGPIWVARFSHDGDTLVSVRILGSDCMHR